MHRLLNTIFCCLISRISLILQEMSADVSYEMVGEGIAQEEGRDEDEQIEDNEHNVIIGEDLRREASADEDNLSEEEVNEKANSMLLYLYQQNVLDIWYFLTG